MAEYGLQIWDGSGVEIFNSKKGCARLIGSFIPSTASGQLTLSTPIDLQLIVNLFAFRRTSAAVFQYQLVNSSTVTYASVWTEGNTIKWRDLTPNIEGSRIFYGDSYV